ncbi:MAG: class I SAM-dependent methyltransferase, partial [Colwellia sp.]|nr:class I SAM-dependent methyltransferase [Colwellia sp.]
DYLVKHYWWAYLSPLGVNFFDHGFMVNRILWGNYHAIAQDAVNVIVSQSAQKVAGISSAYGEFYPNLAQQRQVDNLYLFDIAPIQIKQMQKKIPRHIIEKKCQLFVGDAEHIALTKQSVDTSVLFFLLHELPKAVRGNVLAQAIGITKAGGRLVIADYAQFKGTHLFHRNKLFRTIFESVEPFLANFWGCDLLSEIKEQANVQRRTIKLTHEQYYFDGFYRLLELTIE